MSSSERLPALIMMIMHLTKSDKSIAIGIEELEGGLVQRIGDAQQPLKRLELRERDVPVLVHVHDARDELD